MGLIAIGFYFPFKNTNFSSFCNRLSYFKTFSSSSISNNNLNEFPTLYALYGNNLPTKEFVAMFTGLIDGDGYIELGEQKQYSRKTKELVTSTI